MKRLARMLLSTLALAAVALAPPARAESASLAATAREAILELDVAAARRILEKADPDDPAVALERARLAIYETDYDGAVAILSRPELARTDAGAELAEIAQSCARATAATVVVKDDAHGVVVRLQDEDDRPLVPLLVEVAAAARETLAKDLGVELPRPLHIELVRDLFTLAAMTGLPEQAAQTTGTVAVAKWGRVTMISPRAVPRGYPWADTLAHEMTHLSLTRATADRAPLWLQEGVAKREEIRWRPPRPLDELPGPDATARLGIERGLGRPIDKLGASIAMLPTAEQAQVAFAEVTSFVGFYIARQGEAALPALLAKLKTATGPDAVSDAMKELSGATLSDWSTRWSSWLATVPANVPPDLAPGGSLPREAELRHDASLGELLRARKHDAAAAKLLRRAHELAPHDAALRHHLARALEGTGHRDEAERLVARIDDVHAEFGPWFALNGRFSRDKGQEADAERSFGVGIRLDPFDDEVACEGKVAPEVPSEALREALCRAARAVPRD